MQEALEKLKNITFKPLISRINDIEHLVMIFGVDVINSQSINSAGNEQQDSQLSIQVWYVSETLRIGMPITEIITISDVDRLIKDVEEIDPEEVEEDLLAGCEILIMHMAEISREMMRLSKAISAAKLSRVSMGQNSKGQLVIQGTDVGLSQICFSTINGKELNLNKDEVEKVGSVIGSVIMEHIHDDLTENIDNFKKKLKAEVEYKILEALPPRIKANDININVDAVLEEINKIQNSNEDLDDEDEELTH